MTVDEHATFIDFSYISMYDNNAYHDYTHDYSVEVCNTYKQMLISKQQQLYWSLFNDFQTLFKMFKSDIQY